MAANFDFKRDEYGQFNATLLVPFLNQEVEITVVPEDGSNGVSAKQSAIVERILALDSKFMLEVDKGAEAFRVHVDDLVELSDIGLGHINLDNIRQHYRVGTIAVPPHEGLLSDFFFLSCDCDWEDEHGMSILCENDNVIESTEDNFLWNTINWTEGVSVNIE